MIKGVLELNVIKYRNTASAQGYSFLRKQVLKKIMVSFKMFFEPGLFSYIPIFRLEKIHIRPKNRVISSIF